MNLEKHSKTQPFPNHKKENEKSATFSPIEARNQQKVIPNEPNKASGSNSSTKPFSNLVARGLQNPKDCP